MPGMTGRRVPGAGARARARRAARAAHRLCRHRCGDPRHQPGADPLLPDEAVGPAGGAALPDPRRPAGGLAAASGRPTEGIRVIGHRCSPRSHAVRDFLGPQPGAVPLARRRDRAEAGELLDARRRAERSGEPAGGALPDGEPLSDRAPRTLGVARRSGSAPAPRYRSTIWWSWAAAPPGWRRVSTARRRGCTPC